MGILVRLFKWFFSLFKSDPVKEVQDEAKETVDKLDDGTDITDFLNKQLRK